MEVTIKQLRIEPGRIISQAASGQEITVTYRGKPQAKIIPIANRKKNSTDESENELYLSEELFGIWKDRKDIENVERFVRDQRKGRNL